MIVVIGAGPAGLALGHGLRAAGRDVTLLERETEAGGLCRSFTVRRHTFDLGGHAFFTKHPSVLELVEQLAPEPLHQQPRDAWVYSHEAFVPYPFQSNLFGLPTDVVRDCLVGAIERWAAPPGTTPRHLADYLESQFGPGIAEHFLRPYNNKLWALPLDEITVGWTGERIVQPDIRAIVAGAIDRVDFRDYPNANVRYPARGGFIELYRPLIDSLADRLVHAEVSRLDLSRRQVQTADGGAYDYEHLVATLPLPDLVARTVQAGPTEQEAAAALAHNSLHLVSLVATTDAPVTMHRVYAADPEIPFHKLVLNDTSSPSLAVEGTVGFQAEVSYSPHKPVDVAALPDRVVSALVRMGLLRSASDVLEVDVRHVHYAYPVSTAAGTHALAHLEEFYAAHGVSLLGRFGQWAYINSDTAVQRGLQLAEELA